MKKTLLLSAVLTAILMVLSMAAVFADETTYTVNYETYSSDPTYCTPITCTWDQADLGYKGHTRSDGRWVSVQEEFADDGLNFLGWYTDESFQTQYDPDMTYSQLAGGDMSRTSVTLYAKLGHEHGGIAYVPWGLTDRMPDEPGNYYLLHNVNLSRYSRGDKGAWEVAPGATSICLDRHNILRSEKSDDEGEIPCPVIYVPSGASLTITNETSNSN